MSAFSPCPLSGINTGGCITGDADCDGDPGLAGPELLAVDNTATDNARLDKGEFAVIVVNFSPDFSQPNNHTQMVRAAPTPTGHSVSMLAVCLQTRNRVFGG